ncbi:MAG: sigma-54-dependent Fis family transcriptional regulator [Acidobacteria bacterium]|nr:sigma-54-dependent Fis family transcriptional regulator [Acidobacteriota bacterium]
MTTDGSTQHLLLVDDEAGFREAIGERLTEFGFSVTQAATGEEALERLGQFAFDIIITDLRLPGLDGRAVLDDALARYPDIIAIVITGFGTVREAVEITRLGAEGFITKPFQFEELLHEINAAVEKRRLKAENAYLRAQLHDRFGIEGIIGKTKVMMQLFELLRTVAATASTVLISGETGTGKELAARAIHDASPRRAQRFVAINCSAIPETLLEAELFGHVRGAFTGAVANRVGRIEQAHRGTLFLDEVGTMSPALQAKLLRVLQAREFERLGDSHTVRADVRVIAATNSDLKRMVEDGAFREDLYYRLNVIPVRLPPLRERRADIPLLAQHFLERFGQDVPERGRVTLSQDAQQTLMAFDWPGNVRQLENVIERTFALSPGRTQITALDLPDEVRDSGTILSPAEVVFPDHGIEMDRLVSDFEHTLIRRALERTGGNKRLAADLLHVKRTTLIEKLKRLERVN